MKLLDIIVWMILGMWMGNSLTRMYFRLLENKLNKPLEIKNPKSGDLVSFYDKNYAYYGIVRYQDGGNLIHCFCTEGFSTQIPLDLLKTKGIKFYKFDGFSKGIS
jgi:hypothetical protein